MNSSIITEQRNGKNPEDIMAGLCRSIIQNVFTKVIRVSNLDSLGTKIVVQGGTFENDAVLRAMEEYVGREVIRAPYPGIMGAIGVGLIAKEQYEKNPKEVSTWDLRDLDTFSYEQQANAPCPFCTNHCQRTIVQFSNGNSWVTNNRCEKGEIIGDPRNDEVGKQLKETIRKHRVFQIYSKERKEIIVQRIIFRESDIDIQCLKQKEISIIDQIPKCYPIIINGKIDPFMEKTVYVCGG